MSEWCQEAVWCWQVVLANSEMERMEDIMEESAEGQRLRFLENEIHKTNLKLMEGETIKKKYTSILDMLKKERLTFSNQLEVRNCILFVLICQCCSVLGGYL